MSSAPYFKLYFSDLAGDTLFLSDAEIGSYVLLIGAMWNAGGRLPNDPVKLARIARVQPRAWVRRWAAVSQFFDVDGDTITHQRVFEERQKVSSTSAERAAAGRASAEAKRLKLLEAAPTIVEPLNQQSGEQNPTILKSIATGEANASPSGDPPAKARSRRKPEVTIPDGFPDAEALDDARNQADRHGAEIDPRRQAERFRNHALQNDRRCRDWRAAWRNWIDTAAEDAPKRSAVGPVTLASIPKFPNAPIRDFVVKAHGEPFAVSYLDPCQWSDVDGQRTITAPNTWIAKKLGEAVPELAAKRIAITVQSHPQPGVAA